MIILFPLYLYPAVPFPEIAEAVADDDQDGGPCEPEFDGGPAKIDVHEQGQSIKGQSEGIAPTPVAAAQDDERHPCQRCHERIHVQLNRRGPTGSESVGDGQDYATANVAEPSRQKEAFDPAPVEHWTAESASKSARNKQLG